MIRAYDDNGNVVDLVEWEKQIRVDEISKFINLAKEHEFHYGKENITKFVYGFIEWLAEQLKGV